jgi:hypothetical protein
MTKKESSLRAEGEAIQRFFYPPENKNTGITGTSPVMTLSLSVKKAAATRSRDDETYGPLTSMVSPWGPLNTERFQPV